MNETQFEKTPTAGRGRDVASGQGADTPRSEGVIQTARTAVTLFVILTIVTGVAYPLAVTLVAMAFPKASTGSLIHVGDKVVGSELIGQSFSNPSYFWGRPSATAPAYNGMGGSGSNQSMTNPALLDAVRERIARLKNVDPENKLPIPVDLVTASGSGLDPHISPAAAEFQAARIARLRNMDLEVVRALIRSHTEPPTFGFLGQRRVHVLKLNLSLDATKSS